jgi:hypothetical protein
MENYLRDALIYLHTDATVDVADFQIARMLPWPRDVTPRPPALTLAPWPCAEPT